MGWYGTKETRSLVFIDEMTADRCSRMNSEGYTVCSDSVKCCKIDRIELHGIDG